MPESLFWQGCRLVWNFIEKRLWHRCFPVNFAKFLTALFYRTPLVTASGRQLHCCYFEHNYTWCNYEFKLQFVDCEQANTDLVLCTFKSCLRRFGDSRWWESLTMIPAGDKAKCQMSDRPYLENNSPKSSSSSMIKRCRLIWENVLSKRICF